MTRPRLPIFTRFYQAKIRFLVTLICNDLPKSCCIVSRPVLCGQRYYCFLFYFFHRRSGQTGDCIIILLLR